MQVLTVLYRYRYRHLPFTISRFFTFLLLDPFLANVCFCTPWYQMFSNFLMGYCDGRLAWNGSTCFPRNCHSQIFLLYLPAQIFEISRQIERSTAGTDFKTDSVLKDIRLIFLTLQVLTSQNGQTRSKNSSAVADELFEFVWPFVRFALKGLITFCKVSYRSSKVTIRKRFFKIRKHILRTQLVF